MNYKGYEDGIIRGTIGLGVDYYKGEKGDNGISPTISIVEIQNGHRVIINDVDGEKSFDILDGEDGEGGKGIITRSAEIAYNQVEGNIYRWQTITQPDFTGVNDFNYARVSLKATHNDVSHPYSTYLTLYPNKPGTAFCGYCDGGIYTLTMVGSNWQGGCVDIYKINNKANEIDSVKREIGGLGDLTTEDTSSIVNAINEVKGLAMSNQYTLPTASTSTLGGVKVDGSTITIDSNGVISSSDSGSVYTAGNGISISDNEISVNTDDLVGQGENIASVSYVDNAIANIPSSGGSSYTFTNGLSENEGTVSWNLNDRIAKGTGNYSVIIGNNNNATGHYGVAEGWSTTSGGYASHSEGVGSFTGDNAWCSHAEGENVVVQSRNQHAEGKYNIEDTNNTFQNIAGNGTASNARSNSFARDWNGNEYLAGNLYVGCNDYSTTANGLTTENAGGSKVATESYVDQAIADIPSSGGGSSYTAGAGIDIDSNNVISAPGVRCYPMFTSGLNGNVVSSGNALSVQDEATLLNGLKNKQIMTCEVRQGMSIAFSKLYDYGFSTLYAVNTGYQYDGVFPSPTIYTLSDSSTNNYNFRYRCAIMPIDNKLFVYTSFNDAKTYYMADLVQGLVWKNNYVNLSGFRLSSYLDSIDNALTNINTRVPAVPTADGTYKLVSTISSGTPTYSWETDSNSSGSNIPTPPPTDGNYILTCAVNNGSITYTWVDATIGGTY